MIKLQKWEDWNESLSKEEVMKAFDKFGSTFSVPEIFYFGFKKVRDNNSISPVSGYFACYNHEDYFDGRAISVGGYSYLEGLLDKDKNVLKMIEFYELPHSQGDWCIYDIDLNKSEGTFKHVKRKEEFDYGKIEIVSLANNFILDKRIDGLGSSHIVSNGLQPKRLNEFWSDLKKEGFNAPPSYYTLEERNKFSDNPGNNLPF